MTDDLELLREYAANGSEEAFAAVVSRHVGMVYAAAMRQVGNPHQAEEITQAVFIILARKAEKLRRGTVLSGWLFHTVRLTASNHVRTEIRRKQREQEAYMRANLPETENEDTWRQVAPLLDSAVATLRQKDRDAVVMRFVEGRALGEVGAALGTSESAAQRRIHRAVEKLRKFFTKRGVVLSGSVIATTMAANSVPAAPVGLAASVSAVGAVKGLTAGASTLALIKGTLKVMFWGKVKVAAGMAAGFMLAAGTVVVGVTEFHHAQPAPTSRLLSANSPFVRHLSNPPWIKTMRYAEGRFSGGAGPDPSTGIPRLTWQVHTNIVGLQPSGMYVESLSPTADVLAVSGVDDQIYWTGMAQQKLLMVTPVAPEARYGTPVVEASRPNIEVIRHLGLPGLRQGTFAMQADGKFTAITLKGQTLEGRILEVSNDRPLSLVYHVLGPQSALGITDVTITYQYASENAPLPESFGHTEFGQIHRPATDGTEEIVHPDLHESAITNWILGVEFGVDESVTRGYSPVRFFSDAAQFKVQSNWMSNGLAYIGGVARPDLSPRSGGRRTGANPGMGRRQNSPNTNLVK